MPRIDSEKFYISALKKHGITSCGLNWSSDAHQYIRFEKILELMQENLDDITIADAGCGFGDFYTYLQDSNIRIKKYIGIDSLEAMCNIAAKKTECDILHADITKASLPLSDYYICSGALNILTPFETELFIRNCFESSNKGFIFNALYGEKESRIYNYINMHTLKSLAKSFHVKRISFTDGYLDNDITVGFFK